jgi:uncharacterized protein (DUF1697 family)
VISKNWEFSEMTRKKVKHRPKIENLAKALIIYFKEEVSHEKIPIELRQNNQKINTIENQQSETFEDLIKKAG